MKEIILQGKELHKILNVNMGRVFHQYITGKKARKMYVCKQCKAHLTSYDDIISKAFQGQHGRAYLFDSAINVYWGPKNERVLMTGLHSVCDVYCVHCHSPVGWYYIDAFEESQKYKVGHYVLEHVYMDKINFYENEDK